jgi:hypothetical protein
MVHILTRILVELSLYCEISEKTERHLVTSSLSLNCPFIAKFLRDKKASRDTGSLKASIHSHPECINMTTHAGLGSSNRIRMLVTLAL